MNEKVNVFFKEHGVWLSGLLVLVLVQGWFLKQWVVQDTRPTAWDEAIHTRLALDYQDRIRDVGFLEVLKPAYFNYPPLVHLSLGLFIGCVKDIADAGAILNFLALLLIAFSVYFIANQLLGKWPALTAGFMIGCYPIFAHMSCFNLTDVVLTGFVSLAFLCLFKSQDFQNKSWSIGFGLALGLGMLSKWTALAYLLGPLILSLYRTHKRKEYKNALWALGLFSVVIFPWYSINLIPMLARITHVSSLPPASSLVFGKILNKFWYVFALFKQMNIFFVILFIPGFFLAFRKKELRPIILWFVVSVILFSLIGNRNIRYTMPALPAVAILSVCWIPAIKKKVFAVLNLAILLVFVAFQTSTASKGHYPIGPVDITLFPVHPPQKQDWKHKSIIEKVQALRKPGDQLTRIVTVSNAPYLHSSTLNITLRSQGIKNITFRGPSKRRWLEMYEFVFYKTGNLGPEFTIGRVKKARDFILNPPNWFGQVFKEVGRWPLPDGSEAVLLHAKPDPQKVFDVGLFDLQLEEMKLARIEAKGVRIQAIPAEKEGLSYGKVKELIFNCEKIHYKRITFDDVEVRLVGPQINLPLFLETQEIEFLSLGRLKPQATIGTPALMAYANKKLKWLKEPQVNFQESQIQIQGKVGGLPLELKATIDVIDGNLKTRVDQIRFAKVPFPLIFIKVITNQTVPLTPNREMPFYLDISQFNGQGDKLKLESS